MGIKAEIVDTNIEEIKGFVKHVHIDLGTLYFRRKSFFLNYSIFIGLATSITELNTDNYNTVFRIDFNQSKFITLRCKKDFYSNNLSNFTLNYSSPFKIISSISGLGLASVIFISTLIWLAIENGSESNKSRLAYNDDAISISNMISLEEKISLCKLYIGHIFSKPVDSIEDYKTEGDIVYVKYLRVSDRTTWRYACEIKNNYMVWSAFHNDNSTWGRWRNEDGVRLIRSEKGRSISFTTKDTGETYEIL
jgi:hypothetical protein